ncbi:MAG: alpha/beta hydrolase [Pseudomonadota bacterium]
MDARIDDYIHVFDQGDGTNATTLVMLHGTGGDERSMAGLGRAIADAAAPGAAVLSIRGDVSEGGAARFFRRRAEGVYDMTDLARARAKLSAFLPRALAAHGRDPGAAVAIGSSNGANIAAAVMFDAPRLLAGWALMHPLIPFSPEIGPASGARVLITAGEADPICPPGETRRLIVALEASGADLTARWYPGGHQPSQAEFTDIARWLGA